MHPTRGYLHASLRIMAWLQHGLVSTLLSWPRRFAPAVAILLAACFLFLEDMYDVAPHRARA